MKQEARVILLPTDKAENCILKYHDTNNTYYTQHYFTQEYLRIRNASSHHLYIVDDSEINFKTDWVIHTDAARETHIIAPNTWEPNIKFCRKIIGTTDPELIKAGVPQIPQSFIESYCKNPVEKVMVEYQERLKFESAEDYTYGCGIELKLTSNNELIIHQIEERHYTDADLVSFGNFLLSSKRDVSNNLVTHADLENWKELKTEQ